MTNAPHKRDKMDKNKKRNKKLQKLLHLQTTVCMFMCVREP